MPFIDWLALVEHHYPIPFGIVALGLPLSVFALAACAFFAWLDKMDALV